MFQRAMIKIIAFYIFKIAVTVIVTTSFVYFGLRLVTGDPEAARRGLVAVEQSSDVGDQKEIERGEGGVDDGTVSKMTALLRGYPYWLTRMILFRFEPSYYSRLHPVQLIGAQIGRTTLLSLVSFALALSCAIGLALLHTRWQGRVIDGILRITSQIVIITPEFWLALMLLFCFAVAIPLFPLFGADSLTNYTLPLVALVMSRGAILFSLLDAAMKREEKREYVLSARLRGIPWRRIAVRYQLRNTLVSLIPISVVQFGYLFGGAVIIEQIFSISGFGSLLLQSLQRRDYPVAEGCVYVVALIFATLGAVGDLLRTVISPNGSMEE